MKKKNDIVFFVEDENLYFLSYIKKGLFVTLSKKTETRNRFFQSLYDNALSRIKNKPTSLLTKILARLSAHFFYASNIIKIIKSSNIIVFFDNVFARGIVFYSFLKTKAVFLYTWNIIYLNRLEKWKECFPSNHIVTYSMFDAKKYDISFVLDPYVKIPIQKTQLKEYDFYYCGRAKGERLTQLVALFKKLNNAGFIVKLDIFDENSLDIDVKQFSFLSILPNYISYEDYLFNINKAKCLVECSFDENENHTLRITESIFYEIKMVTNNHLLKQYPFWSNDNMIVADFNQIDKKLLTNFLSKPFKKMDNTFNDLFSVENFILAFKELNRND